MCVYICVKNVGNIVKCFMHVSRVRNRSYVVDWTTRLFINRSKIQFEHSIIKNYQERGKDTEKPVGNGD